MSPVSKSKLKEKSAGKAVRDNGGNNVTSSAYDPISGTFHTLETATSSTIYTQTPQSNGRFRNLVNESEEQIPDTTTEYDSVSNNDSCSVESEDHQKDKNNSNATNASSRVDPNPISDAEKREKIRLKNEKKHQRQRERRAQELHEKCCNYITSRKLESLAQTLVGMGFTTEAATMALIHNKGRVEESAVWILEGGMESKKNSISNIDEANAKIDIKDELSKIVEFESKFKCSKLEVEKAVVACEGDLQKTVELLKVQLKQQESVATISQNLDENGANGFQHSNSNSNSNKPLNSSSVKTPPVKLLSNSLPVQLHRRDHRDFNYTKSSSIVTTKMDTSGTEYPSLRKVQPTNTAAAAANTAAQLKPRNSNVTNNEVKTMREPIQLMQRPQSSNGIRQNAPPTPSSNWYPRASSPSAIDMMKLANGGLGQQMQNPRSNMNTQQLYNTSRAGYYGNASRPSSLAVPSSLGLFKKTMSSSPVDWGSSSRNNNMAYCDYTSVDWSLDSTPLGLPTSSLKGERLYDNALHVSYMKNLRYGENGGLMAENGAVGQTAGAGASEWTSPFTENDLFRVTRMFATSPSP